MLFFPCFWAKLACWEDVPCLFVAFLPPGVPVWTVVSGSPSRLLACGVGGMGEVPTRPLLWSKEGSSPPEDLFLWSSYDRKTKAPPPPPHVLFANLQNPGRCFVTRPGAVNATDGIKVAHRLVYKLGKFSLKLNSEWWVGGLLQGRQIKQIKWTEPLKPGTLPYGAQCFRAGTLEIARGSLRPAPRPAWQQFTFKPHVWKRPGRSLKASGLHHTEMVFFLDFLWGNFGTYLLNQPDEFYDLVPLCSCLFSPGWSAQDWERYGSQCYCVSVNSPLYFNRLFFIYFNEMQFTAIMVRECVILMVNGTPVYREWLSPSSQPVPWIPFGLIWTLGFWLGLVGLIYLCPTFYLWPFWVTSSVVNSCNQFFKNIILKVFAF